MRLTVATLLLASLVVAHPQSVEGARGHDSVAKVSLLVDFAMVRAHHDGQRTSRAGHPLPQFRPHPFPAFADTNPIRSAIASVVSLSPFRTSTSPTTSASRVTTPSTTSRMSSRGTKRIPMSRSRRGLPTARKTTGSQGLRVATARRLSLPTASGSKSSRRARPPSSAVSHGPTRSWAACT